MTNTVMINNIWHVINTIGTKKNGILSVKNTGRTQEKIMKDP